MVATAVSVVIVAVTVYFVLRFRRPAPTPVAVGTQSAADAPNVSPAESRVAYCEKLYETACSKRGRVQDITGIVQSDAKGEIEALRLYEKIIHDHPGLTSDQVDEKLVEEIYTPKRRQRLDTVFAWVSAELIKFIERQPAGVFSAQQKEDLVKRVKTTRLELPPPASTYASELDLFTKHDVYYERTSPTAATVRVGGAYVLTARSWFNRVFTFAHELAHSIDPCELKGLKITSFDRLSGCMVRAGMIRPSTKETQCGDSDQLSEGFADWIAAQITAVALVEYAAKFKTFQDTANAVVNSVRDLCDQESWQDHNMETYPSPRTRIGLIFAQSPAIQRILGCQERIISSYCAWEGP